MPNRSMLRAVGMDDADFERALVGIASAGSEVTPCNMHLDDLAEQAKDGVRRAGGFPLRYNTFVVTDGEAMGHEGMKASLVSRDAHRRYYRAGHHRPPVRRHRRHRRLRQDDSRHGDCRWRA